MLRSYIDAAAAWPRARADRLRAMLAAMTPAQRQAPAVINMKPDTIFASELAGVLTILSTESTK